jgi:D-alanyl-D-alanine carboxypeptidase
VGDDQWRRTLVDPRLALPRDYEPGDLVPVSRAGFAGDFLVRKPVIRDLAALREAAEAEGHDLGILAAYRSYREQDDLFEGRVGDLGKSETLAKTARPGHSEHQLGTAVDFRTASEPDVDAAWESTPEGAWVAANAWRFGFVMSYPRESRRVTCYVYEPWHFRYLGPAAARVIRERGVTVREYLWERQ